MEFLQKIRLLKMIQFFKVYPKRIYRLLIIILGLLEKDSLPNCLRITSENKDGLIMSVSHKKYDVKGIQFHPESVLTENGKLP